MPTLTLPHPTSVKFSYAMMAILTFITALPAHGAFQWGSGTPESQGMSSAALMTALKKSITQAHQESRQTYGSPRVHHSDRGVQYASEAYRQRLAAAGVVPSMSRRGNCYDNAVMESFWSSLKRELVHRCQFATRAQARAAVFEWIEIFYNRERFHSALGYQSPVDFETNLN